MPTHREEHGQYLIEAGAFLLPGENPGENKWQPRLTMTRLPREKKLPKSQAFPGLTAIFATAKGATRYATDLGRRMVDEESPRLTV